MQQQHPGSIQSDRQWKSWNPGGAGLKLGSLAFHLRFAIGRAPSKTLVSGLGGSLSGTGLDPPKGFKRQHRYWVGSYYSSSSQPLKGGQSALWGPLEHLFFTFLRNSRQPDIPGLEVWLSFLGVVPWSLPTSPRATPALTTPHHPTGRQSLPYKAPVSPGPGRTESGGQLGREQGALQAAWPHKAGRATERLHEARPLPSRRSARARPCPPPQPPERHSRSDLR